MPKRLTDNLNSEYIAAANKMLQKGGRKRIVAYVESYDDVFFWRNTLSSFENDKVYFEVMLPSRQKLSRGKKSAMMAALTGKTGQHLIACVDADYDYLLQGQTEMSKDINNNPYILHTYTYAIENYQCYAPSLHDVCVMVTLNDNVSYDFVRFLTDYSRIIFPLFVWNIWHYRHNVNNEFTIADFNNIVMTGRFKPVNTELALKRVKHKVQVKIRSLQEKHPNAKEEYLALKQELMTLGVTPDITYMYIQGHHLFDSIIVPLLIKITDDLHNEQENEIRRSAIHSTQKSNELKAYNHSTADLTLMLRRNTGYKQSIPFKMLEKDIESLLKSIG